MLPIEFTIKGTPVSAQTRNRARLQTWKQRVRAAANVVLNPDSRAIQGDVCVTITYYYEGESPDVDNIIKPIQDALNGIVFEDDVQVIETKSRKRLINGSYRIRGVSSVLLVAFSDGDEFVHVKVYEAPHQEVLD